MLSFCTYAQSQFALTATAPNEDTEIASEEITPALVENLTPITNLEESQLMELQEYLTRDPERLTAGVLAILLGGFGVQHFYTGQTVRGILDIVFCWTGIPAIIGLVEGIIWLCDDDAAFQERVAKWNE